MGYLFFQTLLWILLAFLLGLILGWLLRGVICGPCSKDEDSSASSAAATGKGYAAVRSGAATRDSSGTVAVASTKTKVSSAATEEVINITDEMKPQSLSGPNGGAADDLKRISGVGPVIEKTLNGLGVYHFTQIGGFSEDNIKWVDNFISFPGRIKREEWVSQANELARGDQTEFASRYDKGEVGEDNPNT